MKKVNVFMSMLLVLSNALSSQSLYKVFKFYENVLPIPFEQPQIAVATAEGLDGYIYLTGTLRIVLYNQYQNQMYLAKMTPGGHLLWLKKYTTGYPMQVPTPHNIKAFDDGAIYVSGSVYNNANLHNDEFLIKLDTAGNIIRSDFYSSFDPNTSSYGDDEGLNVYQFPNLQSGEKIVTGLFAGAGESTIFKIANLNAVKNGERTGLTNWPNKFHHFDTYLVPGYGGYINLGLARYGTFKLFYSKVDTSFNLNTLKVYGISGPDPAMTDLLDVQSVWLPLENNFVVLSTSGDSAGAMYIMAKLDVNGNVLWVKGYRGFNWTSKPKLLYHPGGKLIIVDDEPYNSGPRRGKIMETDLDGNVLQAVTINHNNFAYFYNYTLYFSTAMISSADSSLNIFGTGYDAYSSTNYNYGPLSMIKFPNGSDYAAQQYCFMDIQPVNISIDTGLSLSNGIPGFYSNKDFAHTIELSFTDSNLIYLDTVEGEAQINTFQVNKTQFSVGEVIGASFSADNYVSASLTVQDCGIWHYLDPQNGYTFTCAGTDTVKLLIYNAAYQYNATCLDSSMLVVQVGNVGIIDQDNQAIKISPVPAHDFIELSGLPPAGMLHVFDMRGSLVYSKTLSGNTELSLQTIAWEPGMYFVSIEQDGVLKSAQKLIIVH